MEQVTLRKSFVSSIVLYLGRLAGIVISAVTVALTIRYLSVESFGSYSAALAYSGIVVSLLDFGVGWLAARELASGNREILPALRTWKYLVSIGGLLLSLAVLPLLGYSPLIGMGVLALAPFTFLTAINSFQIGMLQGMSALEKTAVSDTVGRLANLALVFAVVRLDLGYFALLAVQGIVIAVVVAMNSLQLRRLGIAVKGVRLSGLAPYLPDLLTLPVITTASFLIYRSDMLILARFASEVDVGIYSAAYRIIDVAASVPAILVATLLPLIIKALQAGEERTRQLCADIFRISSVFAGALLVAMVVAAPLIIATVGGSRYLGVASRSLGGVPVTAVQVLQVLSGYIFLSFIGSLLSGMLLAAKATRPLLAISLVALAINVGANLALVGRYSYLASTALTVLTELVLVGGMLVAMRGKAYLSGFGRFYGIAGGAAAVSLGLYALAYPAGGLVAGALALAAFALLALGSLTGREREMIGSLLAKGGARA